MKLLYLEDKTYAYENLINNGLDDYNLSVTGKIKDDSRYIYIFHDKKLVAGARISLSWNWINYNTFYYEKNDQLLEIINVSFNLFGEEAEGAIISSFNDFVINDFLKFDFSVVGYVDNLPYGSRRPTMINKELKLFASNKEYKVIVSKGRIEDYHDEAIKLHEKFMIKCGLNIEPEFVVYAALDDTKFVGGVVGIIRFGNLYIDALYVDENYRNHQIASKLMQMIENHAKSLGIKNSYLGTSTFQAPKFYEKIGYIKRITIPNRPKGFNNITMSKAL